MSRMHSHRRHLVLMVAIASLLILGLSGAHARDSQDPPAASPLLIDALAVEPAGSVMVMGKNFTPGGEAYIALYDQWGRQLHETRWVMASDVVYGPNGSQDPATGFSQGGTINAIFGASEAIYGPHGSQDPARGYVAGTHSSGLCGAEVMARAFDEQTAAWSDLLDINADC
jgi:hypothetical protein